LHRLLFLNQDFFKILQKTEAGNESRKNFTMLGSHNAASIHH